MKKKTVFEMNMDDVLPLHLYHFEDDGEGKAVEIYYKNYEEMVSELKCSKELLLTLLTLKEDIIILAKEIRKDMIDLYNKIED